MKCLEFSKLCPFLILTKKIMELSILLSVCLSVRLSNCMCLSVWFVFLNVCVFVYVCMYLCFHVCVCVYSVWGCSLTMHTKRLAVTWVSSPSGGLQCADLQWSWPCSPSDAELQHRRPQLCGHRGRAGGLLPEPAQCPAVRTHQLRPCHQPSGQVRVTHTRMKDTDTDK